MMQILVNFFVGALCTLLTWLVLIVGLIIFVHIEEGREYTSLRRALMRHAKKCARQLIQVQRMRVRARHHHRPYKEMRNGDSDDDLPTMVRL